MKRYSSYKDSGVEWIGEIPMEWDVLRGKYIFGNRVEKNQPNEPLLSVTQNQSVVRRDELENRVWNPDSDVSSYKLVKPDDFVISLRTFEGGIELSEIRGIVSPVYSVLYRKRVLDSLYFKFLLKSNQFIFELNKITTGIRQGKNISYDDFSNLYLTVPPLKQQQTIGNYIIRQTSSIDTLIQSKQKKITLLKEKRTSLINQIVTKGLNPNVEMKDSGVEWIGEIPKGWVMTRLKYSTKINMGQSPKSEFYGDDGIGFPFLQGNSEFGKTHPINKLFTTEITKTSSVGDILFSVRGSVGEINWSDIEYCIGRGLCSITSGKLIPKYLWYYLINSKEYFLSISVGSTFVSVNTDDIKNHYSPLPPLSEQMEIVEYLDRETELIDKTVSIEERKIELLKEYKQSLISEVITGKRKVVSDE